MKATRPTPHTTSTQLLKQIDSITENQPNYIIRSYKQMAEVNPDNAAIIYDYIIAEQTEINIKESTKGDKKETLFVIQLPKPQILSYNDQTRYTRIS
ncbi:MAG: hypothetical protein WA323_00390 [Candidatus Nitrosopolaris sp.]